MDMASGPAQRRVSHQLLQTKLKPKVTFGGRPESVDSDRVTGLEKDLGRPRGHHSVPNLPVNSKGKFNYDLQRTGFLGETKMRAKRIAQNPKRFLEAYAEGRGDPDQEQEFVPTELPELDHFIESLALDDRFDLKEMQMKQRAESAKFRTFLLAMTTASTIEVDPQTVSFLESYSSGANSTGASGSGDRNKIYEEAETMEKLVEHYLNEIRSVNTSAIQVWIDEFHDLSDLQLPYGLPANVPVELPSNSGEFGDSPEIQSFIESAQDNFLLLDGQYHAKVEEITKELKIVYNLLQQGWTKEESGLLFFVMNSFRISGTDSTVLIPLQLELMKSLFPGKSHSEITKQKFRLKTKKTLEEKRGAVIRGWFHDKGELQFKMDVAWKEVGKKRAAELERKVSLKKQKDVCDFWAERLQKLRTEKCDQVKKFKILVEPIEKYREHKTKSIAESEAQRREAAKKELKKFQLKKSQEENERTQRLEMERALEDAARKELISKNKGRVSLRANQLKLKEKAKRDLEAALEEQRRQRQLQLEQTKEPVLIDYDPANVVADTHATMVRRVTTIRDQRNAEDDRMAAIFRECYSFSDDTLRKDRRFRFEAKLKDAGLLDSAYARQVLMAMEPKPKPHLQSQVKLSHDDL